MRFAIFAATSFMVCASVTPSFAGFTWTPPETTAPTPQIMAPAQPAAVPALPPMPVEVEAMAPITAPVAPQPAPVAVPHYTPKAPTPIAAPAPQQVSAFEAPALAPTTAPTPVTAPLALTPAPIMAQPKGYEEAVAQKNAVRPIRIDTRPGPVISMPAAPIQITPLNTTPTMAPEAPLMGSMGEKLVPVQTDEARPDAPVVATAAPKWPSSVNTVIQAEIVDGFGRDIPLAMAVRQIVPEGYGLSFDRNVNMNQQISWEGGQSWISVLNAALKEQGLNATLQGRVVQIKQNRTAPTFSSNTQSFTARDTMQAGMEMLSNSQTEAPKTLPTSMPLTIAAPASAATAVMPTVQTPQQASTPFPAPQMVEPAAGDDAGFEMLPPTMPEVMLADTSANAVNTQAYTAQRGMSLRETLEAWCAQAGVELHWASQYDFTLVTDIQLEGTFEAVVKNLLKGFEEAHPKPTGRLHPNLPNGPAVLIIETGATSK